ncbi:RNA polymerase sigma factor [Streptomyces akebiae]|uniref:Sigma-70 family RNA polymerase sigma factor n=1 Tax=Streptomyces akebiae TaxID=2865673 RepID=A0ABX8XM21_9ACTN|nr:sigma-70 family RNA polymerase sigma factor [Streptomyces akebiae]QYX76517.1 sigma-70 family RNA polymerase sigma factor [Streptomyces akebiae]
MADVSPGADFAEYCHANRDRLVAMGILICGSRQQSEDAVQEAMLAAMEQWESIKEPHAWFSTVVRRKLIDEARKWRNRLWRPRPDSELPLPASCPSAQREAVLAVLGTLHRLPARQRQVVHLQAQELTSEEIAVRLGMTVPTVRSHLRHARKRLRLLLDMPPEIDSCGDWLDTEGRTDRIAERLREAEEWLALGLRAQRLAEGTRR